MRKIAILAIVLCLFTAKANSQETIMNCEFQFSNLITYKNNKFNDSEKDSDMNFSIYIDADKNTAFLKGNADKANLLLLPSDDQITFIQNPENNSSIKITTMTTVFLKAKKDNNMPAIHSRHNYFLGDLLSSQYYGYCKIVGNR